MRTAGERESNLYVELNPFDSRCYLEYARRVSRPQEDEVLRRLDARGNVGNSGRTAV